MLSSRVTAGYRCEPFDERQRMLERDVFAEDHQAPFVIALRKFSLRVDEKTRVEEVCFARFYFKIIRADDEPCLVPVREVGDGRADVSFMIEWRARQRGFRPNQHIGWFGESVLGT